MASQEQVNAVIKLHSFGISDEVKAEYPINPEQGAIGSSYDIMYRDPYELYHALGKGGFASHVESYSLTVGTDGDIKGFVNNSVGILSGDVYANIPIISISVENDIFSLVFENGLPHTQEIRVIIAGASAGNGDYFLDRQSDNNVDKYSSNNPFLAMVFNEDAEVVTVDIGMLIT